MSCTAPGTAPKRQLVQSSRRQIDTTLSGGNLGIRRYPDTVVVVLVPSSFDGTAARDAYFAGARARITARKEEILASAQRRCPHNLSESGRGLDKNLQRDTCSLEVRRTTDGYDKALAELERLRGSR